MQLSKIRDYLNATSSIISNMKNVEDEVNMILVFVLFLYIILSLNF